MNPISRLLSGDFGLATTYWLFGVAGSMGIGAMIALVRPTPGSGLARLLVGLFLVYATVIFIAVWRAAGKYPGRPSWRTLARAVVVLGFFALFLPLLATLIT